MPLFDVFLKLCSPCSIPKTKTSPRPNSQLESAHPPFLKQPLGLKDSGPASLLRQHQLRAMASLDLGPPGSASDCPACYLDLILPSSETKPRQENFLFRLVWTLTFSQLSRHKSFFITARDCVCVWNYVEMPFAQEVEK
jgi:hypothetical protein